MISGGFIGVHADSCIPQLKPHQQHRSSEGRILAASRPAKTSRTSSAYAPRRVSFGRITEQLEVPNLLALQTESFDWLVGNEAWQARSTDDPHAHSASQRSSKRSVPLRTSPALCRCPSLLPDSTRSRPRSRSARRRI